MTKTLWFAIGLSMLALSAQAAPQHAVFEGTVTAVGPAPSYVCGRVPAWQELHIRVTTVRAGTMKVGDEVTVLAVTCDGGKHFIAGKSGYELDPTKVHAGVALHVDAEVARSSLIVDDAGMTP